jgi:AraC-like DNA-binding protein
MSDTSVRPYSREFLDTVIARRARTASDQSGEIVEALLPLGSSSLENVSGHLGVSARVLQQRLADEGTSFSSVVHATRRSLAERYLSIDHFSMTTISQLLGFAAPSAFTRWFQQQFGTTPSEWRRRANGNGDRPLDQPDDNGRR